MQSHWVAVSLAAIIAIGLPASARADNKSSSTRYLVLLLTNHEGRSSHRAVAEKEKEATVKTLQDDYEKAKKAYQEEKKAFQKKNPSEKFAKREPQRPSHKVVKSGIPSLAEATKAARKLDEALQAKESKASTSAGKGEGGKKE